MEFRSLLKVMTVAVLAAGLTFVAQRYDLLVLMVALLAVAVVACAFSLRFSGTFMQEELALLRDHLETTRQQAAMLARMTREMRDAVVQHETAAAPDRSAEWAALSEIVCDIADEMAELDRRTEQVEGELSALRRDGTTPRPGASAWSTPASASGASASGVSVPASRNSRRDEMVEPAARASAAGLREIPGVPDLATSGEPPRAVRQFVAAAIAADRFELYLQRIVSLPQRKTRAYEVSLRPDGCDPRISTSEIRTAVEHVGHQLAFDRKLMVQAMRLARMFQQRQRDVTLVADISQRYLLSEPAFDELRALVADAPNAPRRIVLSLPQRFFKKAIAVENEALHQLSEMGFRFMVREVTDYNFELPRLQQSNVRWMRMDANRLLAASQSEEQVLDVAAADFAALLARRQISLLIEGVNEEAAVAELIDFNIAYAQGHIFAPPQAVRPEALDDGDSAPLPQESRLRAGETPSRAERRGLRELARRA
jgi:EAL domain-containing protein (putative c-di-GMP-specific phosphodiesterase class I)